MDIYVALKGLPDKVTNIVLCAFVKVVRWSEQQELGPISAPKLHYATSSVQPQLRHPTEPGMCAFMWCHDIENRYIKKDNKHEIAPLLTLCMHKNSALRVCVVRAQVLWVSSVRSKCLPGHSLITV